MPSGLPLSPKTPAEAMWSPPSRAEELGQGRSGLGVKHSLLPLLRKGPPAPDPQEQQLPKACWEDSVADKGTPGLNIQMVQIIAWPWLSFLPLNHESQRAPASPYPSPNPHAAGHRVAGLEIFTNCRADPGSGLV